MKLRELFNREVPLCFTVIYYFDNYLLLRKTFLTRVISSAYYFITSACKFLFIGIFHSFYCRAIRIVEFFSIGIQYYMYVCLYSHFSEILRGLHSDFRLLTLLWTQLWIQLLVLPWLSVLYIHFHPFIIYFYIGLNIIAVHTKVILSPLSSTDFASINTPRATSSSSLNIGVTLYNVWLSVSFT